MNEVIEDKLSLRNFLSHLQSTFDRFGTNSIGKKILVSPLFLLSLLFLFVLAFPMLIISIPLILIFRVIDSIADRGTLYLTLTILFCIELYALMYVVFLYFLIVYGLIDLMALGLGKAIYDVPVEKIYKLNTDKPKEEENNDGIYVINDEDYK